MDMLRDAIARIEYNVRQEIVRGWHLPESVREKYTNSSPNGRDQEIWFNDLFRAFCEEAIFPQQWTVVEKAEIFGDLLFNRRGKEGSRRDNF